MWVVASIVGVKKVGHYGPQMVEGMKHARNAVQSLTDSSNQDERGVISQSKEIVTDIVDSVAEDDSENKNDQEESRYGTDTSRPVRHRE
jgi:Sec-independent protein translocase protein TatA